MGTTDLLHARWPFKKPTVTIAAGGGHPTPVRIDHPARGGVGGPATRGHPYADPMPLADLRGSGPGPQGAAIDASDVQVNITLSVAPTKFDTFAASHDPAIAVGHNWVLVIHDHRVAFYDRAGKVLPTKGGEATDMSADTFFRAFWEPTRPDGSANQTNINAHLNFPANTLTIDLTKDPHGQKGAIDEFYDSRCAYDSVNRRFVLLSAARNQLWLNDEGTNPGGKYDACVRRLFAFAVSRTEDPRDGFDQWITTASNYADWPRMAVANGFLTVAHNSPESGKPFAYVFSAEDLYAGKSKPSNWQYLASDFAGSAKVLPVTQSGSSSGMIHFVGVTKPAWNPIKIYGFMPPSTAGSVPPLASADIALTKPMGFHVDNPKARGGALYFCCEASLVPGRTHVRVTRVPISYSAGKITVSSGAGFLDTYFGKNGPGDAPGDLVSYQKPAIAVNKNGDCAVVYVRVGATTAKPLYPEVRYSLLYHNEAAARPSAIVRKGDFLPPPDNILDLGNAVVDPVDDATLWMSHAYGSKTHGTWWMVVARAKP